MAFSAISLTQAQAFEPGTNVLNFGFGLGSNYYSGAYYKMRIPPIGISYERGITEKIGIGHISAGGYFGISGSKYEYSGWGYTYGYKYTYITFALRGLYHFDFYELTNNDIFNKFDIYAGITSGLRFTSSKEYGNNLYNVSPDNDVSLVYGVFVGARYYFSPVFGVYTELGYSTSILNFGLCYKF